MARLNRRDFLKALGLSGSVSALSACGIDNNRYYTPVEQLLPYVMKNDIATPGTPTFFGTTVATGPSAFPVAARHRDGRVINVGANTRHPWAPAAPTAALLTLQRLYSPDRYTGPRKRTGSTWAEIDWKAGLEALATAVKGAAAAGKRVAWLGPYRSGSMVRLIDDFTAGNAVFWEPLGYEAETAAAKTLFGMAALPSYDLSECRYVLSFGAPFLSTWGNPKLQSQFARARDPNEGHWIARFALVSPHKDQTGGNADDWLAVKPGTEALVARAIARLVAVKAGYKGPALDLIGMADVKGAATAAGVAESEIDAIATQFLEESGHGGAVALPGGANAANKTAVDLAVATYLLNIVSGNAGKTFGTGGYAGPIHGYAAIESLVADMNAGKIGVLLLDDLNPVYALPASAGFDKALAKVDAVVSLSSHPDETNAAAHLILPTMNPIEDWGDEEPEPGMFLMRQASMTPLHDTRSAGDILLVTARATGRVPPPTPGTPPAAAPAPTAAAAAPVPAPAAWNPGFTPKTWRDYIEQRWRQDLYPRSGATANVDDWLWSRKQDGFLALEKDAVSGATYGMGTPTLVARIYNFAPAADFTGSGDFYLVAYPHPIFHDGRWANEPWAQEAPDPTTGNTWDSWLLLNSDKAKELGLEHNDQVQITTANGTVVLGVEPYPAIRKDTVAIAFGQGHKALGRYAGFGVNVVDLLAVVKGTAGTLAWQQARAKLVKTGAKANLTSVVGHDWQDGRHITLRAPVEELAPNGDTPSTEPGEMNHIEEVDRDERLLKVGITDFYDPPEHPVYRWAMTIDTNACNGCGACAIACYAENNLAVVGKTLVRRGKEMNWLRIDRFWSYEKGQPCLGYLPMMCQQCTRAPCESVCPVLATYHNIEGLNAMIYNRCVGTRYCANNCPYQVRRFNFHSYHWPEPFNMQLNPDTSVRTMGVMEKCTFCVQRLRAMKSACKDHGMQDPIPDKYVRQLTACAEACPTQAITLGNLKDEHSAPFKTRKSGRSYFLFPEMEAQPAINYLSRASFHFEPPDAPLLRKGGATTHSEPAPTGAGKH